MRACASPKLNTRLACQQLHAPHAAAARPHERAAGAGLPGQPGALSSRRCQARQGRQGCSAWWWPSPRQSRLQQLRMHHGRLASTGQAVPAPAQLQRLCLEAGRLHRVICSSFQPCDLRAAPQRVRECCIRRGGRTCLCSQLAQLASRASQTRVHQRQGSLSVVHSARQAQAASGTQAEPSRKAQLTDSNAAQASAAGDDGLRPVVVRFPPGAPVEQAALPVIGAGCACLRACEAASNGRPGVQLLPCAAAAPVRSVALQTLAGRVGWEPRSSLRCLPSCSSAHAGVLKKGPSMPCHKACREQL